ncbi:MAG TPA: hypothetical protein VGQ46_05675 [Thermoanaerobaculia bacterium]|jgi:hypothetical protein|nr:hypothetical protein [Thermoanaerobaculia bacterium]
MRKLLLAFLLFQAVDAFTQPTISAEISSDPLPLGTFPPSLSAPAVALARDRSGVVIAWTMRGADGQRVSVIRLDGTGHFAGPLRTIPVTSPDAVDATAPSIAAAPGGDGFIVTWIETAPLSAAFPRAAYCRLDRDLNPSAPAVLPAFAYPAVAPAIVRSGKRTWIASGKLVWEVRADGSLGELLNAGVDATDMTVATDFPQIVAFSHFTAGFLCPPGCGSTGHFAFCSCPLRAVTEYSLQFTSLYSVTASKIFDFDSDAAPAIGSDGRDVALVWLQGVHQNGGTVVMSRLVAPSFTEFATAVSEPRAIGSFGPDGGATRPDVASDGERYVVVWRTATSGGSHDIIGASVDHAGNVTPLSIATSDADERDPSVIAVGNGAFLVAYQKASGGEQRIAGRFVTFDHRGRAVR